MKYKKSLFIVSIILIIIYLLKLYIFIDFKSIDINNFKTQINTSSENTVVSWWYYGKKNGYHFFMEKWVFERKYYKVDAKYLNINDLQSKFSIISPKNLKTSNLKYLPINKVNN